MHHKTYVQELVPPTFRMSLLDIIKIIVHGMLRSLPYCSCQTDSINYQWQLLDHLSSVIFSIVEKKFLEEQSFRPLT